MLINQAFVSPDEPGHTRHFEMAKFLGARGHELVIVASDLNYQTGQRVVARKGIFAEQNFDGVRVLRSYIYPALHRSYVWRIVSFFSFMFSSVWTALSGAIGSDWSFSRLNAPLWKPSQTMWRSSAS
jgi:hypothetical protein